MTLPFETDEMALLEACAMAIAPLNAAPEGASARFASQTLPQGRLVFKRLPAEDAALTQTGAYGEAERTVHSASFPLTQEALSAEALSRSFERDARRYGD